MSEFGQFFADATGNAPYGYQVRIALDGLPDVIEAPTGTGKTGVILAWLWRWLHGPDPEKTPRRLVYALPQRSLVEQTAAEVDRWLTNLGLTERVALHVVMGDEGKTQRQWRQDMDLPAIVIGTVDSLVSKALLRGYGIARAIYPIDFALVTNGAHWVIDEIQLCRESVTTLRQLAAFVREFRSAEPFGLTCMSATVPRGLLETIDNPSQGRRVEILSEERVGELEIRLSAKRIVRRLEVKAGDYRGIAAVALGQHRADTLTLVVLNTVNAARETYKALDGCSVPRLLLHSRFRGTDRVHLMERLRDEFRDTGGLVVSTQVVEAGIDINASVLVTEVAPWPSLVQRAGRCNRTGKVEDAEFLWVPPGKAPPYEDADLDASAAELATLEGCQVTGEDLLGRAVPVNQPLVNVLRKPDFMGLFDTSPDLSGADLDIAPYVRDADDLDVQLAWAKWEGGRNGAPPTDAKAPGAADRCRVPLRELAIFLKREGVVVWRFDQVAGSWTRVTAQTPARPGELLLVSAEAGGYDQELGFDPPIRTSVPGSPDLSPSAAPSSGAEDRFGGDSGSGEQRRWETLDEHSDKTRDQAERLLAALEPDGRPDNGTFGLPDGAASSAVIAAYLHDVGKAHWIWQDALCALAPLERGAEIQAGRPWAKSEERAGRLRFEGDVAFRHELASLLILDGPFRHLLADAPDSDLVRYLVLAHHGKLRVQVRDPGDLAVIAPHEASDQKILGLEHGSDVSIPEMLGQSVSELTVDLDQFRLGGERSWTRTALSLLNKYGPFTLAYLEAVVRIADWRASAGAEERK